LESRGQTIARMLAINAESGVLFESTRDLDDLLKTLSQFEDVEYGTILNKDGRVISRTGSKSILANSPESRPREEFEDSTGDEHKQYFIDTTGTELLVITVPIVTHKKVFNRENLGITAGLDNSVAVGETVEEIGSLEIGLSVANVSQSIHEAQMAVIFLTVFVLLFAVLVIAVIVSAITNPITELVTATDQISRGDLTQQVEIDRGDEIGHLAKTFNSMVVSLRQTHDEIEQYNRTLEENIIERTRQLEDAQNALIQSEKMSAIGQLAAGVAHELNNPLGGILGYAQFTIEKLQKNVPEKTSSKEIESYIRYVTDIEVQARRCKQIVQNLLRFSRSSRTMEFAPVDLNKVIEETVTFMEHQLHMNQIELVLELEPALPLIQGNAGQLQQVFTNLIINAMHASQQGA
jgi:signal transduction histidine kinase